MTILIAASNKDIASLNIKRQILNHYNFKKAVENFQENPVYTAEINGRKVKLVTLNEESVEAQNITEFFKDLELILFISRHSSESGTPTLSVHTPGNLGEAELGGLPRKVSVSPAHAMRNALKALKKFRDEMHLNYEVCYECTHHGPSLNVPAMFVELGSSPKQWNDLKAAEAVAHAAIKAISTFGEAEAKAVLGIGGPHYNSKFTRIALENETAFGHMIPKYVIPYVNVEILRQCVQKTLEKVEYAILDWKGIKGEHKPKLVEMLNEIDLPTQKV
ncbi:MAG: D-aminoacyl-tRNA deacylase [Candidatus Bathyarchaeota archaeon]|nr:D-aminoacyl-tRNA deacylase [Candidatus Bathyarchaeota archaeon]MDI6805216.1 D-aminoacyl-tRNA deacylase [Candidatus Bathyarchaeia archaeon]